MTKAIDLAKKLAQNGEPLKAQFLLVKYIRVHPDDAQAWFALAYVVKDKEKKINCLKKVISLDPQNVKAKTLLNQLQKPVDHHQKTSNSFPVKELAVSSLILSFIIVIGIFIGIFFSRWSWDTQISTGNVQQANIIAHNSPSMTNVHVPINTISQTISVTTTPLTTVTQTPTQTQTATPTITFTLTKQSTATPTSTASPTSTPTLPSSARITNISGRSQSMPLSCEASSASDWARFFGYEISESAIQAKLPLSDNPNRGFVGSVYGTWGQIPPNPYGVHADPIAIVLRSYGVKARSYYNASFQMIQKEIAQGHPVIVWVVGKVWSGGVQMVYESKNDGPIIVAPYEHTVMVIGYNESEVIILDGSTIYSKSISTFLDSWEKLGSMIVVWKP
jgi:uncharacterized protein YvpB